MTDGKFRMLYINIWNHLFVCKKKSGSFKNVIDKLCLQTIYQANVHVSTVFGIK